MDNEPFDWQCPPPKIPILEVPLLNEDEYKDEDLKFMEDAVEKSSFVLKQLIVNHSFCGSEQQFQSIRKILSKCKGIKTLMINIVQDEEEYPWQDEQNQKQVSRTLRATHEFATSAWNSSEDYFEK
jgi:hypothetical protein